MTVHIGKGEVRKDEVNVYDKNGRFIRTIKKGQQYKVYSYVNKQYAIGGDFLAFLKPGMNQEEISATFRFIPLSILLLIIGFLFAYYILLPSLLKFTTSINEKLGMVQTYGALEYFSFVFNTVIPVTILFQQFLD